ncbi:hypothetical protein IE53DRAFT_319044 [Violaceomyces palustris]|uniref:Uncharacterized protein n=1 Tax=Violaceomyces palustris TaxID=1673888 RepID=A0ACD0NS40_9BASI|nr:hypothetical protein IE53DRAFT_319044 [Violaceomyces palustris]
MANMPTSSSARNISNPTPTNGHLGQYQLGDCLGKGAFGSVYRGLNWMTGETVAVKQIQLTNIPKSELGEIMSEIDLLKNLNHPNIVKYKGSEKTREYLYIILEYCENGSLQHICKRFGKFPEGLVGVYISQVLDGLLYLHDQGVIHRDIKGANILTTKDGSVKLADFGVATRTGAMSDYAVVGSPYWMAPEVIDQSGATTASDIWSVGCVVVELLEGKPPYHYLAPMPALFRIVQDDCPPLPEGASPIVKDFLLHCFQKDSNLRVSARKLLRHPWMVSARRQLDQMKSGGSIKGTDRTVYDEAVKSVQEWNQALKDPPKPPPGRAMDGGTLKVPNQPTLRRVSGSSIAPVTEPSGPRTPTRKLRATSRPQLPADFAASSSTCNQTEASSATLTNAATSVDSTPGHQREQPDSPTFKISLGRAAPAPSLLDQRKALIDMPGQEEQTDNWDDDFEEDITTTKIAALEKNAISEGESSRTTVKALVPVSSTTGGLSVHDHEDDQQTIRPPHLRSVSSSPRALGVSKRLPPISSQLEMEDYSDLVSDDEESHLDERVRNLRLQNSVGRRLFHPNDLKSIASGCQSPSSSRMMTPSPPASNVFPRHKDQRPQSPISPAGSRNNSWKVEKDEKWKEMRRALGKYSEGDEEDYSDLFGKIGTDPDETGDSDRTLQLTARLSNRSWLGDDDRDEDDPFAEIDEGFEDEGDLEANVARDKHARLCAHVTELVEALKPDGRENDLLNACEQIDAVLTDVPEMKEQLLSSHGALALIQLLEKSKRRELVARILGILNMIIFEDPEAQENLCLIGAIPVVMTFTSKRFNHDVRLEAAHFVFAMCSTSSLTLQFVLSCRGLKTLVDLIDEDYNEQKDLVWIGVGCVNSVLELQSPASRNDFCRMLAQEGLLEPLSMALISVIEDSEDPYAQQAQSHIIQTFLIYSQSDSWLKKKVATRSVLRRLLKTLSLLEPVSLTLMLKIVKNLSMSPTILDEMQNCNTIEILTRILSQHHAGPHGTEMSNQVLNTMYNLCRLNKSRQEEAAQAGIIPELLRVSKTSSPLKQFALPILCDFAHAGKATRKMFWQHDGLSFYLKLLEDPYWQVSALESILVWLQDETARVEQVLLERRSIDSLLCLFTTSKANSFENLLEPLLKICRLSNGVTIAMARKPEFLRKLIQRLGHTKAVVRLNLLRITKMVCDIHPDRIALIEQYSLLEIIERLSSQDAAILVRELARDILSQRYMQQQLVQPSRTVRRTASETDVGSTSSLLVTTSSTNHVKPKPNVPNPTHIVPSKPNTNPFRTNQPPPTTTSPYPQTSHQERPSDPWRRSNHFRS